MKTYQKAELIAKNLPTGSYAAGCPTGTRGSGGTFYKSDGSYAGAWQAGCAACEVAA